jgi:hypothetical protein
MLLRYVKEILSGAVSAFNAVNEQSPKFLLRNDITSDGSFEEGAGTALLASVVFRLAVLFPDDGDFSTGSEFLKWASSSRLSVFRQVDPTTGILSPVVDPMDWKNPRLAQSSSEGQCFALILFAAWRDYMSKHRTKDGLVTFEN